MNMGVEKTISGKRGQEDQSFSQSDIQPNKGRGGKSLGDTLDGYQKRGENANSDKDKDSLQAEAEQFPSLVKLREMGIKDFKPSIKHRILTMGGLSPKLRLVSPKVTTTWPSGRIPKSPQEGTPFTRN